MIYRIDTNIPFNDGLAICIQSMVLENSNKKCGTGTIFTRDPITGDKIFVGKFSKRALNTCVDMNIYSNFYMDSSFDNSAFAIEFSTEYDYLKNICVLLENHYKDMLKVNFVVNNNKLFITRVCKGKRTS